MFRALARFGHSRFLIAGGGPDTRASAAKAILFTAKMAFVAPQREILDAGASKKGMTTRPPLCHLGLSAMAGGKMRLLQRERLAVLVGASLAALVGLGSPAGAVPVACPDSFAQAQGTLFWSQQTLTKGNRKGVAESGGQVEILLGYVLAMFSVWVSAEYTPPYPVWLVTTLKRGGDTVAQAESVRDGNAQSLPFGHTLAHTEVIKGPTLFQWSLATRPNGYNTTDVVKNTKMCARVTLTVLKY